mgnify:CR=1 FL=1
MKTIFKQKYNWLFALLLCSIFFTFRVNASVSGTLDAITADASFSYTGGDGRKLSQLGRHAYSFGRIRFSNPSTVVNLVNLTPPSISPPNCSSININLGSFDIISLDEAIAILRRVASEALTYGFGLALQSMCSPCWTSMKTLQSQLERLNLANRDTCTMVKSFIDEKTNNGDVFNVGGMLCDGEASVFGDDAYVCNLEDSGAATFIADRWEGFIDTVAALGGDPNAKFLYGNVVAETFAKSQGLVSIPDSLFPSDLSTLILGMPTTEPTTTPAHPGISPTEAAMNFFGYYRNAPNGNNEKVESKYIIPPVQSLNSLLTSDLDCLNGKCRQILQCEDVSATNPATGNSYELPCGSDTKTPADYSVAIASYNADASCTDKAQKVTLPEIMRCYVQGAFTKLQNGDIATLTDLQQKIIKASPPSVIRAFSIGTEADKSALMKAMDEEVTEYLANMMIYNYVTDLAQMTTLFLNTGEKEMSVSTSQVTDIYDEIDKKLEDANKLKVLAEESLAKMANGTAYNKIVDKYSKSMSRQITSNLNK